MSGDDKRMEARRVARQAAAAVLVGLPVERVSLDEGVVLKVPKPCPACEVILSDPDEDASSARYRDAAACDRG